MRFKRSEELVNNVEVMLSFMADDNNKEIVKSLLEHYKSVTYKNWEDRHEFNREFVSDMVNDCGFDHDGLAEKMANEHPTLQQNFMRMCKAFIKKMAEKKYYDGRNESSVLLARKLSEEIDNFSLPFV